MSDQHHLPPPEGETPDVASRYAWRRIAIPVAVAALMLVAAIGVLVNLTDQDDPQVSASSGETPPSERPTATPTSSDTPPSPSTAPITSSSASFSLLPAEQPPEFVSEITCDGPIGASDPVAVVELRPTVEGASGETVLRDYVDPANPKTVCHLAGTFAIEQLIDARHLVIWMSSTGGATTYAIVDLPEVRFHWFQLPPRTATSWSELIAVAPGLDQVLWLRRDPVDTQTDTVHITDGAGDHVVATLPDNNMGRCGSPEDSNSGAYSHSGDHLFVLDQPLANTISLLVVEGQAVAYSLIPPSTGWPVGEHPAWAIWSPTSETLFYRQRGDVWQWTPEGGAQVYLPGVNWYFPTVTPDGSHLAYSVARPDGLHNVYLVDLVNGTSPQLIAEARNLPAFVNSTQLWYRSEGQGVCGHGSDEPLIYNITDGSESPSIIEWVRHVWPATTANAY